MDRAIRLAELWNWLPAFRTVAETEHLPTAAQLLHVSASALSRSVTQLEHAIGYPLFTRAGRRIRLNPAGEALLAATRDAMRRLDDGLGQVAGTTIDRIRLSAPTPWLATIVLPAIPPSRFAIDAVEIAAADLAGALLRGQADLAIEEMIAADDRVAIGFLGTVERAVWRGAARDPDGFAVCTGGTDGWPIDQPRRVALRSPRLDVIVAACAQGMTAVLPVAIAKPLGLRRIAAPAIPPSQLYLARRRPLAPTQLDDLVAAIAARASSALGHASGQPEPATRRRKRS